MPKPVCPPIAADVIAEIGTRIVLIERRNFPFGWAIPGGFVEVGEKIEDAAVRELREETSLEVDLRALLGVYSRPDRDPRFHAVTVVVACRIAPPVRPPANPLEIREARLFTVADAPRPLANGMDDMFEDALRGGAARLE